MHIYFSIIYIYIYIYIYMYAYIKPFFVDLSTSDGENKLNILNPSCVRQIA